MPTELSREVQTLPIDALIPYERNPRKTDELAKLARGAVEGGGMKSNGKGIGGFEPGGYKW
jgi:hypothetical protein